MSEQQRKRIYTEAQEPDVGSLAEYLPPRGADPNWDARYDEAVAAAATAEAIIPLIEGVDRTVQGDAVVAMPDGSTQTVPFSIHLPEQPEQ